MPGRSSVRSRNGQLHQKLFEDNARVQNGIPFEVKVCLEEHGWKTVDAEEERIGDEWLSWEG